MDILRRSSFFLYLKAALRSVTPNCCSLAILLDEFLPDGHSAFELDFDPIVFDYDFFDDRAHDRTVLCGQNFPVGDTLIECFEP